MKRIYLIIGCLIGVAVAMWVNGCLQWRWF